MKKIYIAGALNSDAVGYLKNVSRMIKTAIKIQRLGCAVFVPCLDLLTGIVAGNYEYNDYFDNNAEYLKVCDGIYIVEKSDYSVGTQKEKQMATELDIPIFKDMEILKKFIEMED